MQIRNLKLKNWRNFRHIDVPLRERTFIVGPNAVGKSNLLDVFRFIRDIAQQGGGGLQKAMSDRGGLSKVRCLSARKDPVVEISLEICDDHSSEVLWKYELGIKQETRGTRLPQVHFERVEHKGKTLLSRPIQEDVSDPQRLTQTHLEQVNSNRDFRDLAKFFDGTTYLHLVPQLLRYPDAFAGTDLPGDPFGRGFLNRIAETREGVRDRRLKAIETVLKEIVPQLSQLEFTRDQHGLPHLQALYTHWRPNAGKQREDQFSDGTLRLIGLFWALLDKDSVLLLEEPELSLNSKVVAQLPPLIWQLQKKRRRQVIISSHSPSLLGDPGIEPEGVLLLRPGENGTEIEVAAQMQDIQTLLDSGMSIADVLLPRMQQARFDFSDLFSSL